MKNSIKIAIRATITTAAATGAILAPKFFDNEIVDTAVKALGVGLASTLPDAVGVAAKAICETDVKVQKTDDSVSVCVTHTDAAASTEPPKAKVKAEPIEAEPATEKKV